VALAQPLGSTSRDPACRERSCVANASQHLLRRTRSLGSIVSTALENPAHLLPRQFSCVVSPSLSVPLGHSRPQLPRHLPPVLSAHGLNLPIDRHQGWNG